MISCVTVRVRVMFTVCASIIIGVTVQVDVTIRV